MSRENEPRLTHFNFRCDPQDKADFIANAKERGMKHEAVLRHLIASANILWRHNKTARWPLSVVDDGERPLDSGLPLNQQQLDDAITRVLFGDANQKKLDEAITRVILGDGVLPVLADAVAQAMVLAKERRPRLRAARASGIATNPRRQG